MGLASAVAVLIGAGAVTWRALERDYESQRGDAAAIAVDAAIGATVEPLDRATAGSLGIAPQKGLVITSLARNGPAARAGIRPGDVVERIGKTPIGSPGEAAAALRAARAPVELRLNRRGQYAIIRLPARPLPDVSEEAEQGEKR